MSGRGFTPYGAAPVQRHLERRIPYPLLDVGFYEKVAASDRTNPVEAVLIAPESGRAVKVPAGHVARVSGPEGPQIGDVDFFNASDPSEHLWANQTLLREGAWLTTGSRLWGNMPNYRPLMTIVADTVPFVDRGNGARHHIIIGSHCPRWYWWLAIGDKEHSNCYDQLCSAARAVGIDTSLVHDNLNLFQKSRVDFATGHYVTEGSDARPGDYVDFYAEIDIVMAISTCPLGSGARPAESGQCDPKPLRVEVYETGIEPSEFSYEGLRSASLEAEGLSV